MIKVAMIGAPCTGKTTTAKMLAEEYNLVYVPEWATVCIAYNQPFTQLSLMQYQMVSEADAAYKAADGGKNGIVVDGNLSLGLIYAALNSPAEIKAIMSLLIRRSGYWYDLGLYLPIGEDTPLKANGIRRMDETERKRVDSIIQCMWFSGGLGCSHFVVVGDEKREDRMDQAREWVQLAINHDRRENPCL